MKRAAPKVTDRELLLQVRRGEERAKTDLIKRNQGLVVSIAKKYAFNPDALDDLVIEGNMGLLKAMDKFDLRTRTKFGTYAYYWIKRYILRSMLKELAVLRIPERQYEIQSKTAEFIRKYTLTIGCAPTDDEIAEELHIPLKILRRAKRVLKRTVLPQINPESAGDSIDQLDLKQSHERDFGEDLYNHYVLERIFNRVNQQEKRANIDIRHKILKLNFGIDDGIPHSYKEIAKEFDISRQRVHQILHSYIKKLQREWKEMQKERKEAGHDEY